MNEKTVIQSRDKRPTIKCAACGKPLPIFETIDSLPVVFEKKCGFCGEEFMYSKSDINTG